MECLGDEFGCSGSCCEFWSGDRFVLGVSLDCAISIKMGCCLFLGNCISIAFGDGVAIHDFWLSY